MSMPTAMQSKSQLLPIKIGDIKSLESAIRIVKYHAVEIASVSMSRRTAQSLTGEFVPARPLSIPNPFVNDVVIEGVTISIDDSLDAGMAEIRYQRLHASDDAQIKRKVRAYTLAA